MIHHLLYPPPSHIKAKQSKGTKPEENKQKAKPRKARKYIPPSLPPSVHLFFLPDFLLRSFLSRPTTTTNPLSTTCFLSSQSLSISSMPGRKGQKGEKAPTLWLLACPPPPSLLPSLPPHPGLVPFLPFPPFFSTSSSSSSPSSYCCCCFRSFVFLLLFTYKERSREEKRGEHTPHTTHIIVILSFLSSSSSHRWPCPARPGDPPSTCSRNRPSS